jgi:hypothetical protein
LKGLLKLALSLLAVISTYTLSQALELITPQEATLPNVENLAALTKRGLTHGPSVFLILPPPQGGVVKSPIELKIGFEAHGGARVDLDRVKVTYLKLPLIDLTERVSAFIKPTGIDVPNAELPAGTHFIRVELMDADGRAGSGVFSITVLKSP